MKYFSLIKQEEIHPSTDEKIISKNDFSTLLKASEILRRVKKQAARYKKAAILECENLKKEAQKEGFHEGLSQFNEHLLSFEEKLKKLQHETQQAILPIALRAAKKIVGKELEIHPETIVDIVLQALTPVTQNQKIIIYVNRSDKEILEANKTRIREILEQIQTLSIQERSDVSPGGCIIETESGIINASLHNQWRALESAFEKYMVR